MPYSNLVMPENQQLNKSKKFIRASAKQRIGAGVIFIALAALFTFLGLAATERISIDKWVDPCGFQQDYDLPCHTCGMTTSALVFVQGRIFESFYIQPAGGLLCCVLVLSGFFAFVVAVFGVYFRFLERFFAEVKIKYLVLALIIIIIFGWLVTLARAATANQG